MPYFPPSSQGSNPTADAFFVGTIVFIIASAILWNLLAYLVARSARSAIGTRWSDALRGEWVRFPVEYIEGSRLADRDWALARHADGARIHHEAWTSNRVIYTKPLEGLPEGWSFEIDRSMVGGALIADAFNASASTLMRARGGFSNLIRGFERIFESAGGARMSARLDGDRLTIELDMLAPARFGLGRVAVEDPLAMVGQFDGIAHELTRLAELGQASSAEMLARHLDPPSSQAEDALIVLMSSYPDSSEMADVLDRALGLGDPFLQRCVRIFGVDERVWELWNPSVHATSYMRTRAAVLERIPPGPGRVAFVRDLIDRFGLDALSAFFGEFAFDERDWKPTTEDALFRDFAHWGDSARVLIEDACHVVEPDVWWRVLDFYLSKSMGWESTWISAIELPRAHALAALEHADFGVARWLELLEGDASEDVIEAIMSRLEWAVDGGDGEQSLAHADALCRALSERSVRRALPLMRRAFDRHRGQGETIERAIGALTAGIDPGVAGGVSVADDPASLGGLSVTTHADASSLSSHADDAAAAREVFLFEDGAEEVDEEVADEVVRSEG